MGALIMVAEDTLEISDLLKSLLTSHGHQVETVSDGIQMIEKAKDWRPHLIISDIMMPGTYGSSAYNTLQQDPVTAKIPVIFLTAVAREKATKIIQESDRVKILYKPLDVASLLAAVDAMLGKEPPKP